MSQELNPQGYNYGVDPVNINPFWDGGGDGGSDDYNDLRNQPQINGVTLSGNKTTEQLHLDYTLPTASADTKGGVKIGSGLSMDGDVLSANEPTPYTLPTASADTKGGIKVGSGLTMTGDVLSANEPTPYSLPTASASTKGGVKVGDGLTMNGEVLSADRQLPVGSSQTIGEVLVSNGASGEAWRDIDDVCLQVPYSESASDVGKVLTKIGTNQDQYAWLNAQASYTDYSGSHSGLQATTVQAAIDELAQSGGGSNVPDPTAADENKFLVATYDDDADAVVPMWGNGKADKVRYSAASGNSFPSSVKYVNAALDVLDQRSQVFMLNSQTIVPYDGVTDNAYKLTVYDGGDIFDDNKPAKLIGIDVSFATRLSSGDVREFAVGHAEFDPQYLVNAGYRELDSETAVQAVVTIPVSRVYDSNNSIMANADMGSHLRAHINFNTKDSDVNNNTYSAVLAGMFIEADVKVGGQSVSNIAADSQLYVKVYKQIKKDASMP